MKFLKDYLGLTDEQIEVVSNEDATAEQLTEINLAIQAKGIDFYKKMPEFKELTANAKRDGFAEGSRKVKKEITKSLGIAIENIDDATPEMLVQKIKETQPKDARVKELEDKYFEANNALIALNESLSAKENEIKATYKSKFDDLVIAKKKAEFLANFKGTIDNNTIALILKGKEASGDIKYEVAEDGSILPVDKDGNRLLNEKKNGHLAFEEFLAKELTPFQSNNNGLPSSATSVTTQTKTDEPKEFSPEFLEQAKKYAHLNIQVA